MSPTASPQLEKTFSRLPGPTRAERLRSRNASALTFLFEAFRTPLSVGAVAPTSPHLARALVDCAAVESASTIIELGPGTGAVTEQIVRTCPETARVLAVERNAAFAQTLEHRFPQVRVVRGCATQLHRHARAEGFSAADSIISALPWTVLAEPARRQALTAAAELLAHGGIFTTVVCLGLNLTAGGRDLRATLKSAFRRVETSRMVWRNLPPAIIYRCSQEIEVAPPTVAPPSSGDIARSDTAGA